MQVVTINGNRWYGILLGYFKNIYEQELVRLGPIGGLGFRKNWKRDTKLFFDNEIAEINVV